MRLGTLMLRDGTISLDQLEEALKAQILHGGRLGTNLVTLGFVSLQTLGQTLARAQDLPLASEDALANASDKRIKRLGSAVASACMAIALADDPNKPEDVCLAMLDPDDADAIQTLQDHLGRTIHIYVAPELVIREQLEKHYQLGEAWRSTIQAPVPGKSQSRGKGAARARRTTLARASPAESSDEGFSEGASVVQTLVGRVPFETCLEAIEKAQEWNEVCEALVYYTVGRYFQCLLFEIQGGKARPLLTQIEGNQSNRNTELTIALDDDSLIASTFQSREWTQRDADTTDLQVAKEWGFPSPTRPQCYPLHHESKTIALLYLGDALRTDSQEQYLSELSALCEEARQALFQLLP